MLLRSVVGAPLLLLRLLGRLLLLKTIPAIRSIRCMLLLLLLDGVVWGDLLGEIAFCKVRIPGARHGGGWERRDRGTKGTAIAFRVVEKE